MEVILIMNELKQYYQNEFVTLYCGDCLEIMPLIDKKFNLIIADLPYEQTPIKWDVKVDMDAFWRALNLVKNPDSAIALFGQEPFSSFLRMSNLTDYKFDWYWQKEALTNVFQIKRRPGKVIETISMFYENQPTYNPQKFMHKGKKVTNKDGAKTRFSITQGNSSKPLEYQDDGTRFPLQILKINGDNRRKRVHPTQKPTSLMEYLIKTYTNENDLILDPVSGSGTTGVACINLNRKCVLIEKEEKYCEIIINRLKEAENEKAKYLF